MNELHKYVYNGPVMEFDICVSDHWKAETMAVSEKKAKSNFKFQYKKKNNKSQSAKIDLPGKITLAD